MRFLLILFLFFLTPCLLRAEILTSTSFQIWDPVMGVGGGRSTSYSFGLEQSIGELSVGTSTAGSFQLNAGFLTWPEEVSAAPEEEEEETVLGLGGIILNLLKGMGLKAPQVTLLPAYPAVLPATPDLDLDNEVGLKDLSIFLFVADSDRPELVDFNNDHKADARDLSFLFFRWTERLPFLETPARGPVYAGQPAGKQIFAADLVEEESQTASLGGAFEEEKEEEKEEAPEESVFRKSFMFFNNTFYRIIDFFVNLF